MEKIIKEIKRISEKKSITFSENYYRSSDNKTIMGEVPFEEILFLDYRETEAGSNPREYTGLKKTNLKIIQSLLEDHDMFRILHSGVIVSLVNPEFVDDRSLQYDDCCLTNGNQTRFIILILVLLKVLAKNRQLKNVKKADFKSLFEKYFQDSETMKILHTKFNRVSEIINFLQKSEKYLKLFNTMNLRSFLDTRIRIQINLINSVIEDSYDDLDSYYMGTLIAEANNNTQNVKADDIFGTKNREALNEKIFRDFNSFYEGEVKIEFRLGEVLDKVKKVHILQLLRLIVATGILTKENDIFKFTNQRIPIYRLFEKLLQKHNVENTVSAISKLIPLLYKIRVEYVEPYLQERKRDFIRKYKEKAIAGNLSNTRIGEQVNELKNDEEELEKFIRRTVSYNIEHIIPVLIFRIRMLFGEKENGQLDLTIPEQNRAGFFGGLIEAIYKKYIDMKLAGLSTSLTTEVRDEKFYEFGDETYIAYKDVYKLRETDYIKQNEHIIR